MKYNIINGVELNPEDTINNAGYIFINEGTFEYNKGIFKFSNITIPYNCEEWLQKGSRINVYYNPDINKYTLTENNISAPHEIYGYHLGGITLQQPNEYGNCISNILLPINTNTVHYKFFNYEYDESYQHLYHLERPENIFDEGFDEGFDDTQDPIEIPESKWDGLI